MAQKEEIYARQFYQELKNEFWSTQNPISKFLGLKASEPKSDVSIALKEAGTQSQCTITKQSRQCSIHCFDIDRMNTKHEGPEFYATFLQDGKPVANGRTFNKGKAIEAIKYWIQNKTLEELYSQFGFIDEKKRQLEKLRSDINASNTQLLEIAQNEVSEENFSYYSLCFKDDNRSCEVSYYGYETNPRYIFNWDDSVIFETSGSDTKRLGSLVKKWVCNKATLSTLKMEFTGIDFGKLAEYYEQGRGIEGEFILSWDNIESFYREMNLDKKNEILQLIKEMRDKGFDSTLRAGQSLYTFILSRSRRHGLRENQDSVSFSFVSSNSAMEVQTQNGQYFIFDKIEYNNTIENILKTIELESID